MYIKIRLNPEFQTFKKTTDLEETDTVNTCIFTHLGDSLALLKGGGEGDISGRGEAGVGEPGGLYSQGGEDSSPPTTAPSLISGLE